MVGLVECKFPEVNSLYHLFLSLVGDSNSVSSYTRRLFWLSEGKLTPYCESKCFAFNISLDTPSTKPFPVIRAAGPPLLQSVTRSLTMG